MTNFGTTKIDRLIDKTLAYVAKKYPGPGAKIPNWADIDEQLAIAVRDSNEDRAKEICQEFVARHRYAWSTK